MVVSGSSPRLRGAPGSMGGAVMLIRLIPASAGSTGGCRLAGALFWAHPRVCGEHFFVDSASGWPCGSSPRLRGAHLGCARLRCVCRLIPASAGSTTFPATPDPHSAAHPRVCGEHLPAGAGALAVSGSSPRLRGARGSKRSSGPGPGSSPRLRGALTRPFTGHPSLRLIPASAGSTLADKHFRQG